MNANILKNKLPLFIVIIIILYTVRSLFSLLPVSAGDLTYFFPHPIREFFSPPYAWETFRENGLGGSGLFFLGSFVYNFPFGLLGYITDYAVAERIIWFLPIITVGIVSISLLSQEINITDGKYRALSVLIFLLNSYFLMIFTGGQITVSLGYVFLPLVIYFWLRAIKNYSLKNILLFALSFSLTFDLDFRYAYLLTLFLAGFGFFYIFALSGNIRAGIKKIISIIFHSVLVFLLLQGYWLLPYVFYSGNPAASISSAYISDDALKYFSTADFPKSFSLLHPNYPENIFGKASFMKPAFLFYPLLAFCPLLFLKKENRKKIVLLSLLAVSSSFLAKGVNGPFPQIYLFLFNHFPGFVMFRDPTKFYVFTALAYSLLLPGAINKIMDFLQGRAKNKLVIYFIFVVLTAFPLFLVKEVFNGKINGILRPQNVPEEYLSLEKLINKKNTFFRTLWVPSWQRYGYYDNGHPAVSAEYLFDTNDPRKISSLLGKKGFGEQIALLGIKYVIIPFDSQGEKFLTERKYDEKKRQSLEKSLDGLSWLKNKTRIGKLTVYEIRGTKDHFWFENGEGKVSTFMINPAMYTLKITNKTASNLLFSENYSDNWRFSANGHMVAAIKSAGNINKFPLRDEGTYIGTVEYLPQKLIYPGLLISGITLLIVLFLIIMPLQKKI